MNMNDMDVDGSWKHYKLEEFVDFVNFLLSFEGFALRKDCISSPFFPSVDTSFECEHECINVTQFGV